MTFGCQMNFNDSDWLSNALAGLGFCSAPLEKATVIILNTCSVREKPEQKVYAALNRIRHETRNNTLSFVVVAGCVAQQLGTSFFERFPQVRIVSGTDGIKDVPSAIEQAFMEPDSKISLIDFSKTYPERGFELGNNSAPPVAYVNIMQGCDNFCAYCIVPFTRGRQKSRSTIAILNECKALLEHGTKEICLLGQNVNAFGQDKSGDGTSFAQLLYKVANLEGLERLRIMTPHPKDFATDTINAFGELKTLCPHIHLPMQAGSDNILSLMKRKYNRENFLDLVGKLRSARPDISFSTDIIVGFPHENEEDFLLTCSLVEEVGFRASFSFCYSDRPGTAASLMPQKISQEVQLERLSRLQSIQAYIEQKWLKKRVGVSSSLLLENISKKNTEAKPDNFTWWQGRDPHGVTVNVALPQDLGKSGLLIKSNITTAKKHTLMGEYMGNI